jgi:hypothetical protein
VRVIPIDVSWWAVRLRLETADNGVPGAPPIDSAEQAS